MVFDMARKLTLKEAERELKKTSRDYEKIVDKLDNLNDEAFRMEQDIMFFQAFIAQKKREKITKLD